MLTHGHEDHIGATPYLLRERGDIPLVGSQLTLALLDSKLREHRLKETVQHVVKEGDRSTLGPFDLEFVAVNHSIPDALAVAIRTGAGTGAAHRRLQDGPAAARRPDHRPARVRPARRGGRRPVPGRLHQRRGARASPPPRSTSARCSTGSSTSSDQRIIVACFASHVHRVQQVIDAAVAHGRKVAYVGRSMVRNMGDRPRPRLPHTCPPDMLVDAKDLADLAARATRC